MTSAPTLRAEWTKFRSVRSTGWTLIVAVGLTVLLTYLITNGSSTDARAAGQGEEDIVVLSLAGIFIGQIAIVALGTLAMTSEYATGLIRATFAAVPRRSRVVMTKAVVVGVAALVAGSVACVASFLVARPVLHGNGYVAPAYPPLSLTDGTVLRAVGGGAAFLTLLALMSLGVGAIVRRTAGAISVALGLVLVPSILTGVLPVEVGKWVTRLTPSAGLAIIETAPPDDAAIGPWAGLGVAAAYAVGTLLVAMWLTRRRDVS
jgi:ABC-2 family transporter protein